LYLRATITAIIALLRSEGSAQASGRSVINVILLALSVYHAPPLLTTELPTKE
jgi:hypothetical protein